MLEIQGCMAQGCDDVSFIDTTGVYDAVTNPTGYGVENGITSPSAFTTYRLSIWDPSKNYYAEVPDPTIVINLLLNVPTPNADGDYVWTFTAEDLGLTAIKDGQWYWEVVATSASVAPNEWDANAGPVFLKETRDLLDQKMLKYKIGCKPCGDGCENIPALFAKFLILECDAPCGNDMQTGIDYIQSRAKSCC